jgi:hypothetical protein
MKLVFLAIFFVFGAISVAHADEQLSPQDAAAIVEYLAKNYGTGS